MLHPTLLAAGVITFIVAAIHSVLGERMIIGPILMQDARESPLKSAFKQKVLRNAWHLQSLGWCGMGLAISAFAFAPLTREAMIVLGLLGLTFIAHGIIVLAIGRGRHHAWIAFLAIGALAIWPLWG